MLKVGIGRSDGCGTSRPRVSGWIDCGVLPVLKALWYIGSMFGTLLVCEFLQDDRLSWCASQHLARVQLFPQMES